MVALDPRARRAWSWLPDRAEPGTIWQGPTGQHVRVNADGSAELVPPSPLPHTRGRAADPSAGRRPRTAGRDTP